MNPRTKLAWVDIPRQSLRRGLACGEVGARIMLLTGNDRPAEQRDPQPDAREADKPR